MHQNDEDFGEGIDEEATWEIEGSEIPDFVITYSYIGNTIVTKIDAADDDFDEDMLAEFVNFISSQHGAQTTLETLKEGLQGTDRDGKYQKFIISFLRRKQEEIAKSIKGTSEGPLIRPVDVL